MGTKKNPEHREQHAALSAGRGDRRLQLQSFPLCLAALLFLVKREIVRGQGQWWLAWAQILLYTLRKNQLRIHANGLHSFLDATNEFPDIVHIWLFNRRKKYSAALVDRYWVLFCIVRREAVPGSEPHVILFFSGSRTNPPRKGPSPMTWGFRCVGALLCCRAGWFQPFPLTAAFYWAQHSFVRIGESSHHSRVSQVTVRLIPLRRESSMRASPLASPRMCFCPLNTQQLCALLQ